MKVLVNAPVYVVVPAAGNSIRMGGNIRKPYLDIMGMSVLERTLRTLASVSEVSGIVVVASAEDMVEAQIIAQKIPQVCVVTEGGSDRQASVINGLEALVEYLGNVAPQTTEPIVLIHDAARCLVSTRIVHNVIEVIANVDTACGVGMPVADTIRRVAHNGHVGAALPVREELVAMQTPQGARLGVMLAALREAKRCQASYTDDLEALIAIGYPVQIVQGEANNFKLTTLEDWQKAQEIYRKI